MKKIAHIIGVGPGNPDLIPIASQQLLQEADVIAGFKTVNEVAGKWTNPEAHSIHLSYANQEEGLNVAASLAQQGRKVVFTAWGDFNFSGHELIERIEKACGQYGISMEYIPGISSLQVACSKVGLPMEESLFITLHKRHGLAAAKQELVKSVTENERHLFLLPHTFDLMPTAIAAFLLEQGQAADRSIIVMENLTLPNEHVTHSTLQELSLDHKQHSDLSIVVIPRYLQ